MVISSNADIIWPYLKSASSKSRLASASGLCVIFIGMYHNTLLFQLLERHFIDTNINQLSRSTSEPTSDYAHGSLAPRLNGQVYLLQEQADINRLSLFVQYFLLNKTRFNITCGSTVLWSNRLLSWTAEESSSQALSRWWSRAYFTIDSSFIIQYYSSASSSSAISPYQPASVAYRWFSLGRRHKQRWALFWKVNVKKRPTVFSKRHSSFSADIKRSMCQLGVTHQKRNAARVTDKTRRHCQQQYTAVSIL